MLKKAILTSLVLTLVGCTAHLKENTFIAQDKTVTHFEPSQLDEWQNEFPNHNLQPISIASKDGGVVLKGLFLDHPDSRDVIYYQPGNGMKISRGGIQAMATLSQLATDLVIFDRRGIGASAGTATIDTLISDAVQQVEFVKTELGAESIVLHGFSLGSFVAAQVTRRLTVDALVLQGSATNVDEWIDSRIPWYSKPFLTVTVDDVFHTVDNKEIVSSHYSGPLLIIAGEQDEQAPASLSQALFEASQSEMKQLLLVEKANHNTMLKGESEIDTYRVFLTTIKE